MVTAKLKLAAEKREFKTKCQTRTYRAEGSIPAALYTNGGETVALAVNQKQFLAHYADGCIRSKPVSLEVAGGEAVTALAKHVQIHPVTELPVHIEFVRLRADRKIVAPVLVKVINKDLSPGIKRGGTLNIVRRFVDLRCDPESIPEFITVDLDGTRIGRSIHISHVALPEGCVPVDTADFTICTIVGKGGKQDQEDEADEKASAPAPASGGKK